MNPELLRNMWIELTERRVTLMLVIVSCVLLVALSSGDPRQASTTAELLFYAIVVLWGTRCAAQAVVEEIGSKTWDGQRLSAIRPWPMVWGKLLGSTMLAWLGGVLCLAVILYSASRTSGLKGFVEQALYFVTMGITAQAVALLASLVAVRRRLTHSRFDIFLYQAFGLAAAFIVFRVWQTAGTSSLLRSLTGSVDFVIPAIPWWGGTYDSGTFYTVSLVALVFWTLLGNYRVMRTELQVQNGPWVWIAFLAFLIVYAGGFDFWREHVRETIWQIGIRAVQASSIVAIVVYMMALVEPKEIVAYRWLIERFRQRRFGELLSRLPAWIYAYLTALVLGIVTILTLPWAVAESIGLRGGPAIVAAALGFMLRDCAIFMAMGLGQVGKKSDIAALAIIAVLYFFLPALFFRVEGASAFFYPSQHDPIWLNPALAWAQALIGWFLILRRRDLRVRPQI